MCGLVAGWIHPNTVDKYLKKLQYRGSDSLGLGNFTYVFRTLSKTIKLSEMMKDENGGNFGDGPILGHSRWASSGEVSLENTHPILSEGENVLLVHNGTLTNYGEAQRIEEIFFDKSYEGKTDTELLADFLEHEIFECNFPISFWKSHIDSAFGGTYAIAFLLKNRPNVYWMTQDSPLYYYEGQLSSDPTIWPKYFFLPNNAWGWVKKVEDKFELYVNGRLVEPVYSINNSFSEKQEEYVDYMLKEIGEQCTLSYDYFEKTKFYHPYNNVEIIACGSSYNISLLGKKYAEIDGNNVSVSYASEYSEVSGNKYRIAISQSGESADVIKPLKQWNLKHQNVILITNNPESTAGKYAKTIFSLDVGQEHAVAATKTFTASGLMLLSLLNPSKYFDLDLNKFRANLVKTFNMQDEIKKLAQKFVQCNNCLVLGSGLQYSIAREGALKLIEVAQIYAVASSSAETKHGLIALINNCSLSIILMPDKIDSNYELVLGHAKQIKARHGQLVGIGPYCDTKNLFDNFILTPRDNILLQPLINNMVLQLLSYYLGKLKGFETSQLKNCAKAITVY